jgi:DNA-directed RNA polymerase specialized sigma24 family protein
MDQAENDVQDLLERIRRGDQDAACEFVQSYGPAIFRVIRRDYWGRYRKLLQPVIDPEDIAQDTCKSWFRVVITNKQLTFTNPDTLISFLIGMAEKKVLMTIRKHCLTQKRDARRVQSLHDLDSSREAEPAARQPTALDVAIADELVERLTERLPVHLLRVAELLAEGLTHVEIAQRLRCCPATVARVHGRMHREFLRTEADAAST